MLIKKSISENDAWIRLSTKCAMTEYCVADIRRMMSRWELPEGADERIVKRLQAERFVDEGRYAHAFVRDKFRYNHWGWGRIERELRMRGVAQTLIDEAKEEISEEDNLSALRKLIEAKRRTVKGKNEYEINAKLFRFAMMRGFGYDDINKVLHTNFEE
jgi:regulatory protein